MLKLELSADVISKVKSSFEIADLNDCIIQLINNSIDSQSECIKIQVDFDKFNVIICDDGNGMSEKDLELIGE